MSEMPKKTTPEYDDEQRLKQAERLDREFGNAVKLLEAKDAELTALRKVAEAAEELVIWMSNHRTWEALAQYRELVDDTLPE
jgi:hypothetical protein